MSGVAKRYALAVFELANEENQLDKVTEDFKAIGAIVSDNLELASTLNNPMVDATARKNVMRAIVERMGVSTLTKNSILLISDHRRADILPQIAEELGRLSDEKSGRIQAEVRSAAALSDSQYQRVTSTLEKLTGRKVRLSRKVDAALIGGVVVQIGDKVFDGSIVTRLQELRVSLLAQ